MKVFIEEVLQVLAIEIVGVGCMTAAIYGFWKVMSGNKKVKQFPFCILIPNVGRTVAGVAVLPTLKGCQQVSTGGKWEENRLENSCKNSCFLL